MVVQKRLLLVEDEFTTRRAMSRILKAEGYEILQAENVAQAKSQLSDDIYAVILDLMLPDGDGMEVLQTVKNQNLPTKVIITTGSGDSNKLAAVAALKPDALLMKPVKSNVIIEMLRS